MGQQLFGFIPAIGLLVGLTIGIVSTWFLLRARAGAAKDAATSESKVEITRLQERVLSNNGELERERAAVVEHKATAARCQEQLSAAREECAHLAERANRVPGLEEKCDELTNERQNLQAELAKVKATLAAEQAQTAEKLTLLQEAKEQLSTAFTSLANNIFEEKTVRLTEQNNNNIGQILEPFKTKLDEFKAKVEEVHDKEIDGRAALREQVNQLTTLNQRLSEDAQSLANALKGSAKTQGNWGEMILVRLLEASGLREGRDYELRPSYQRENGHRGQPDIVIHLPGERHLIIDSKVSLTDYTQYVNAVDEADRTDALGRHLNSMHRHVKELSDQDYQNLYGLNSLDFVIMFVPIESAFAVALEQDTSLWEEAWSKNVLVVSPSTLLFVLRTVAYLWQQEDQARNVQEIAHRGAELYNKLVGFVEDLGELDDRLRQARVSFDSAYKKLSSGRGNVIRQAEMLKEMGVKPNKALPVALVEAALEDTQAPSRAAVAETEVVPA